MLWRMFLRRVLDLTLPPRHVIAKFPPLGISFFLFTNYSTDLSVIRVANPSQEDAPVSSRVTDTETTCVNPSSLLNLFETHYSRVGDDDWEMDDVPPSASIPCVNFSHLTNLHLEALASRGPSDSAPPTALYKEGYRKRGEEITWHSTMFESAEDFAIRFKEMDERSMIAGALRNKVTRQRRLKDSPNTHMTKPGDDGIPIELRTLQSRWEYYKGKIFYFSCPLFLTPCRTIRRSCT